MCVGQQVINLELLFVFCKYDFVFGTFIFVHCYFHYFMVVMIKALLKKSLKSVRIPRINNG